MNHLAKRNEWNGHSDLVKSVSRSFFLSLKFLPCEMREPVALGYLLARLSDTIADSGDVSLTRRRECLDTFREKIGNLDPDFDLDELIPAVFHPGEKELLSFSSALIRWLSRMEEQNQAAIREVLQNIIAGQTWDLEHFAGENPAVTEEELETYTYRVAGCVGEFWTRVGYINLGSKFARIEDREFLLESGKKLGQGLQLINILRDLHEDLPVGRNYLPDRDFTHRLALCREYLEQGKAYVRKVRSPRAKFATALPLFLAEATADALESAGWERVSNEKIKVPRSTVWKMATKAALFS